MGLPVREALGQDIRHFEGILHTVAAEVDLTTSLSLTIPPLVDDHDACKHTAVAIRRHRDDDDDAYDNDFLM